MRYGHELRARNSTVLQALECDVIASRDNRAATLHLVREPYTVTLDIWR
jgi:hypothetical protein